MFRNLIIILVLSACSGTQFEGAARQRSADDQKSKKSAGPSPQEPTREVPAGDDEATDPNPGEDQDTIPEPTPKTDGDDETQADDPELDEDGENAVNKPALDYSACLTLPLAGLRNYGKCGANEAVVIVNDGLTPQMTCCPVSGNFLTTDAAKQHQPRTGKCLDGEVLTGMQDAKSGAGLCTELSKKAKILELKPSIYSKGQVVSLELTLIAASYNANDTCVCPAGTVAVGGHSASDNVCTEQCALIGPK